MTPTQLLRETLAAARSQRVPSALVAILAALMCVATLLTVGRSVTAERDVAARLDAAGSRLLVVRDARSTGVIRPEEVGVVAGLAVVDRAVGLTTPVDVTNGVLGEGGPTAPAWAVVGAVGQVASLIAGRWPQPGESLITATAARRLGLVDGIGWVRSAQGESAVVGVYAPLAPFEQINGVLTAARPGTVPMALHVIASTAAEAPIVQRQVLAILTPATPDAVVVESPLSYADLQRQVGADVGRFGRSLVFGTLGTGALLVGIVVLADVLIRRRDLGRRRALGATRSIVVGLVVLRTLLPATAGALLGASVGGAIVAGWGVAPGGGFVAGTAVLTSLSAGLAALGPAVYAGRQDPVRVLRTP